MSTEHPVLIAGLGPAQCLAILILVIASVRAWAAGAEPIDPARAIHLSRIAGEASAKSPADAGKWSSGLIPLGSGSDKPDASLRELAGQRQGALHLVIDDGLLSSLQSRLPDIYQVMPLSQMNGQLLEQVAGGDSMVWVGSGEKIAPEFSVRTFVPVEADLGVTPAENSPLLLGELPFHPTRLQSAYVMPITEIPRHNVTEEVRADFLPILEARDRFGRVVGYPGALMSHYAPSFARQRFAGSDCYYFLFDDPAAALDAEDWLSLLQSVARRHQSGLQVRWFDTNFDSYETGEWARASARIFNHYDRARACTVAFELKAPGETDYHPLQTVRSVPEGNSESLVSCDFKAGDKPGLWLLRITISQDPDVAAIPGLEGIPQPINRHEEGFVVRTGPVASPDIIKTNGMGIELNGENSYWAATTYYPSNFWWEWRDFHPATADRNLQSMRRHGYRMARIWLEPVHDEQTLRAVDALIQLAAQYDFVLDVCVFTQWSRWMGYQNDDGRHVLFEFRPLTDYNMYGISFRNLDDQRNLMRQLAKRWKDAGNLIYNLSNEVYVNAPSHDQMDPEAVAWDEELGLPDGVARDSALFRHWADTLTQTIREAGGDQLVIPGYMFDFSKNYGGDTYQGNLDSDIVPWHDYGSPEIKGDRIPFFDPLSSNRPIILEEFGGIENTAESYDGAAHYTLAAGAAACMAYEWGISWLARDYDPDTLPLFEYALQPDGSVDPRFFSEVIDEVNKTWTPMSVGTAPWPSGFWNSSIYDCTPFPMPAAVALGRLGLMGKDLGRVAQEYQAYVVIPTGGIAKFDQVAKVFHELRAAKAVYGVWQERDLENLPSSAKVLMLPAGLNEADSSVLGQLRQRGVRIFEEGQAGWLEHSDLPRIDMSGAEGLELYVRPTVSGTVYCLLGKTEPRPNVGLNIGTQQVTMGWQDYGLARFSEAGLTLVEATGDVALGGTRLCHIANGRALIASPDDQPLLTAPRLRMVVTEPTTIEFGRKITSVSLLDGLSAEPLGELGVPAGSTSLELDPEASRYVLLVTFAD